MRLSDTARPFKPVTNLLRGRPVLAIFEICLRCNSACGYCDLPLNEGRYELSRDEIKTIFTGLYRDGIRHLFIQGGEPFVRRDCIDILEDLDAIGYRMTVITNGTRCTPELVARLKQAILAATELDTRLVMRPLRNTERVLNNPAVERLLAKEQQLGSDLTIEDILDEVAGVYPRVMQDGDMDAGAWSCGMVAGLIHDIPTCAELIDRIMTEADALIRERLVGLAG